MHSEISEDLRALMCRVYDPTKNIPSLRSPLPAVTFIFPRHKQVDRVSSLPKGAFNRRTAIFLSRGKRCCESIVSRKENVLLSCS